jgi:hypothetical protein
MSLRLIPLTFQEIVISNVGDAKIEVNNITITGDQGGLTFLQLNPKHLLKHETFVTLNISSVISACDAKTYAMEVSVEAKEFRGGQICQAHANSSMSIVPDCHIEVNMKCTVDNQDGMDCSELKIAVMAQGICKTCAHQLIFLYTASQCANQTKEKNKGLTNCTDLHQLSNTSHESDAPIVVTAGPLVV